MKKSVVLFLVLAMAGLVGCSTGSEQVQHKAPRIAAIDSLIQQEISVQHIPGAVIQVKRADSTLHRAAYGYARQFNYNMEPLPKPEEMTVGHLFDLASLTKVCATTFGIMKLVDEEKLRLDDTVNMYLPDFEKGGKAQITIRHLLTHTAGLYQWKPTYYHAANARQRYQYISELPLKWPVGEGRHYSDLGFMLLGDIIKKVSGKSLDVFLQEKIYQPLKLEHTVFNPNLDRFPDIAATSHGNPFEKNMVYDDDFGYAVEAPPQSWDGWRNYTLHGEVNDGNTWYANSGVAGHAGLFSTVDDLQVLVDVLLNKGKDGKERILSAAVVDTFLTKDRYGNGLGWAMNPDIISAKGTPAGTFGHTGFTGTNIVVIPEYDLSIILLTNRQHVGPQANGYYASLGNLRQHIVNEVIVQIGDEGD